MKLVTEAKGYSDYPEVLASVELDAVEQIKANNPISEDGSNEFRYLAKAYNKMYEKNKSSIESLSYKAFHDELTGAYNRARYEFLLSNIELETTYVMHSDVVQRNQLEKMIKQIENELENTDDGLPPIYISIGIMDGKDARDKAHLFELTDLAMYESKKQGKGTYTFY